MERLSVNERSVNPKQKAGFLSSIFFWWTYDIIRQGNKKPYEVEDLPAPLPNDFSQILGNRMETAWMAELEMSKLENRKCSLLKTIVRIFRKEFLYSAFLHSFNEFFVSISRQIFLGYFLECLKASKENPALNNQLRVFGVILVLSYALNNLLSNHFFSRSYHLGCRIKLALSSLMYRKCLRLGNNPEELASTGRILNLMSNDLARFDDIVMYCNYAYSGLISTIIIGGIICHKMNVYVAAICVISVFIPAPVQLFISKQMAGFRGKIANASDERIRMMDEIICGIQIIKMYAWERPYAKLLMHKRRVEIKLIQKGLYLRAMRIAINLTISKFSLYAIVVVYVISGGKIVPEMVFVLLGYCSIIAKVMSGMFFRSFGECSECYVSLKRIQNFMELKEFQKPPVTSDDEEKHAVEFKNVSASWKLDETHDILKDVNLYIECKKLTTIVGQIGSGKSSLLNVVLGELPPNKGEMVLKGTVSYYSQIPWIFAGTIRKNILFSEKYIPDRYARVVEVCALKHDFDNFPDGDLTPIGERGVTLSGGQKARIALARAVYKNADIYLLDDPLSAVDTNVNKQIFQECILDFLHDKTRILITHQLQFLMNSDQVVLLKEGNVKSKGNFKEVVHTDPNFMNIFKNFAIQDDNTENEETKETPDLIKMKEKEKFIPEKDIKKTELEKEDNELTNPFALMQFLNRGAGIFGISLVSVLFILTQTAVSACDIWLAYWTSAENAVKKNKIHPQKSWNYFSFSFSMNDYFVIGYTAILISVILLVTMRNLVFAFYGQKCSKRIHKDAFHSVVYTNPSFFHNNPSGRILNRFSKDMGAVDEILIPFLLEATASFIIVLAAFMVSASISVAYIIPAIFMLLLLLVVRHFYLKTSINLKRLESITKSPIFVHVHNTLQGLPIIRACSVTDKLIRDFDKQQDVYSSAWYLYNLSAFGYAYCLEVICVIYLALIVTGSFFLDLTGSEIGLALAQLTILLNFVQWAMKLSAEVSNQATSVDRLLRYSELKSEIQPARDSVSREWPSKGRIVFENVSFKYNLDSSPAIKDISFTIGIVGRTGAGKTTLLAVMFRLGYVDGTIKIDNVDTSDIRLEKLRSKISVIPQDPVLFSGTLRKNIDPFGEFDDFTLWRALEEAQLKNVILENNNNGLETVITEGGKNFSVGQRQLICLARAIIRKNRILILDEATANVDQHTDSIIQKTIKERLRYCTVLTIAHRLNTVIDSDKILVMDNGEAVEFDHPYQLLMNPEGYFYKLVLETGEYVAASLTKIAKENYNFYEKKNNRALKKIE